MSTLEERIRDLEPALRQLVTEAGQARTQRNETTSHDERPAVFAYFENIPPQFFNWNNRPR